jgi:ATP-dependent Clp protease, protease subunit
MKENTVWKLLWTLGGAAAVILLAGLLTLQTIMFIWIVNTVRDLPEPRTLASIAVDEIVESGSLVTPTVTEDTLLKRRSILLTHSINENTSRAIVEKLLLLNAEDPTQPIELYLSSPGGWGGSAFTIIEAMKRIEAPVNAHAIGICYSSCALVLVAATGRRTAMQDTIMMVHANLDDSNEPYSYDRLAKARYEKLWHEHSTLPEAWFPMTADKMYYLSPQEALDYKVIDEVIPFRK